MMDEKTREALEASIQHWKENAEAKNPHQASTGDYSCALCQKFKDCTDGCPVYLRTGEDLCDDTPWEYAYDALRDWKLSNSPEQRKAFHEAALAELAFLESLRPENE